PGTAPSESSSRAPKVQGPRVDPGVRAGKDRTRHRKDSAGPSQAEAPATSKRLSEYGFAGLRSSAAQLHFPHGADASAAPRPRSPDRPPQFRAPPGALSAQRLRS